MIELHRLAHTSQPFLVNPDLVAHVEASPDTHVTLTTGTKYVVRETPAEITEIVRAYRVKILADALVVADRPPAGITAIR